MKNLLHDKRFFVVAIVAGLVAMVPFFVVLAAQGQITEVNPSGISSVQGAVSVGEGDDERVLAFTSKTTWRVIGQGENSAILASFYLSASVIGDDGPPVFVCKEVGQSLSNLADECQRQLTAADPDLAVALESGIDDFAESDAFGLREQATENLESGILGD